MNVTPFSHEEYLNQHPVLVKCLRCSALHYRKDLERNAHVCPECDYHFRLSAPLRIAQLLDTESFVETDGQLWSGDPFRFEAGPQPYAEKVREERRKGYCHEALITGTGRIGGFPLVLGVMEFGFIGGSMGTVVGEKITRLVEVAMAQQLPLLLVTASGGARMQEGIFSLLQMAKVSVALAELAEGGVPFISLLTDPTTGGVMASFALSGQVILAEPGALICFAGPRVIEQFTHQSLPPGVNSAEQALQAGMIDGIVHRRDLKATLARIVRFYQGARGCTSKRVEASTAPEDGLARCCADASRETTRIGGDTPCKRG